MIENVETDKGPGSFPVSREVWPFVVVDGKCYFTTKQLATMLHLAVRTLANWRSDHNDLAYHKIGGRILYEVTETMAWIASHRLTSTSDPNAEKIKMRRRRRKKD